MADRTPPPRSSRLRRLRDLARSTRTAAADAVESAVEDASRAAPTGPLSEARQLARGVRDLAGPAATLARSDVSALRAWGRNVRAVEETLGRPSARAYTRVVVQTAEHDPDLARLVAFTLPDHLARVQPDQRGRYVKLLRVVLAERAEALPLVVRTLPDLLPRFDDAAIARYLAQGVALHAESSRKAESFLRLESGEGRKAAQDLSTGTSLDDLARQLTLYARAHCGETVQVRPVPPGAGAPFTDGRHLYLPPSVDRFGDERDRLVYRVLAARAAGYLEFGSLDLDLEQLDGDWPAPRADELEVERMFRAFPNRVMARDLFTVMEDLRVEARVRDEYPGIGRAMDELDAAGDGPSWRQARPELDGMAPAEQAIEAIARLARGLELPELPDADAARAAAEAAEALDLVRNPAATVLDTARAVRQAFTPIYGLLRLAEDPAQRLDEREPEGGPGPGGPRGGAGEEGGDEQETPPGAGGTGSGERGAQEEGEGEGDGELDYTPLARDPMDAELRVEAMGEEDREVEQRALDILRAIRAEGEDADLQSARQQARSEQSYEEMAAMLDRMEAPGGGIAEESEHSDPHAVPVDDRRARGVALDPDVEARPRTFHYPEWDAGIEDHKPAWVRLTEYDLLPGSPEFVTRVRDEQGSLIAQVRRAFEALRPEGMRRIRGLSDGDELDLDRVIEAFVERRAGGSPTDRLYTRHQPQERDVAVAFLVDMSSSTNEVANAEGKRIIDVEKEALVLISEAVDAIGDDQAIYGFSGYGRDQVAFYVAKEFEDPWDDRARERIGRMTWKMENRDGAAIRHATAKLVARHHRIKLLILLSDGKPLDCGCDHYADRYAQEDTRVALQEARKAGVHPFCITVDPHGHEYLARTYGEGGYTIIDRVDHLPRRLVQVYRRLTR